MFDRFCLHCGKKQGKKQNELFAYIYISKRPSSFKMWTDFGGNSRQKILMNSSDIFLKVRNNNVDALSYEHMLYLFV